MQRRELLVTVSHGERLRRLDETARTLGVFLNIHRLLPSACRSARGAISKSGYRFCVRSRPIFSLARDLLAKPRTLSRITREGTDAASSLGFRAAALTFLNQPAVVAIIL
jgi:hypothetical protein